MKRLAGYILLAAFILAGGVLGVYAFEFYKSASPDVQVWMKAALAAFLIAMAIFTFIRGIAAIWLAFVGLEVFDIFLRLALLVVGVILICLPIVLVSEAARLVGWPGLRELIPSLPDGTLSYVSALMLVLLVAHFVVFLARTAWLMLADWKSGKRQS